MSNILDELQVPQPPYRMPRPVAKLAAAEGPLTADEAEHLADQIKPAQPEVSEEERYQRHAEKRQAEVDREYERFVAPEQMNAEVDKTATQAEERIQSIPPPPAKPESQAAAIQKVETARAKYHSETTVKEGRTPDQASAEFRGERKELRSVEDEYESTEAALRRAEAAGNQAEVQRLTKLAQQYSDAIEKKNMPPQETQTAPKTVEGFDVENLKQEAAEAAQREEERLRKIAPAPAVPEKPVEPAPEPGPKPEPTAEERYQAAMKRMDSFRNRAGSIGSETLRNPAYQEAQKEFAAASEALHPKAPEPQPKPEQKPEPKAEKEVVPPAPEPVNPDETIYRPKGPIDRDDAARVGERVVSPARDKTISGLREVNKQQEARIIELEKLLGERKEEKTEKPEGVTRREFMGIPKEPFIPEPPENRRERIGGLFGFLRESLRWTIEKTGIRPWLDTIALRFKSVFPRRFAEMRMMQQSRAQNKLNTAKDKLEDWKSRAQNAGFPMRLFYTNRMHKWEARVNKWEARVDKYDGLRQKWQERHNDLQRQVSDRYDRELQPYQEKVNVLKKREAGFMQAKASLKEIRDNALKELSQLRAQATKKHWWQSTQARADVRRAEKAIKDIERRMQQADKEIARVQAPLVRAKAKVDKWELKKKTVAQLMQFSQAAGLKRPKREEVPIPEQRGVEVGSAGAPTERAPESATQEQRFAEEWRPDDFAARWNGVNLKPEIENMEEFAQFVGTERARAGETGTPKLGELLDIAERYLRERSSGGDMRQFANNRRFFIANIKKR